nr:RNA-directed DNA polymerase, eukaryota [Tanacetum cinerariifolium]
MVRNTSTIQDTNGRCWKFRNNKQDSSIPIRNQFHKEVEKIASSFYITNFPDYVDAKRLWVECQSYGRIVDAFIENKRSKAWKRQEKNEAFSKNNGDKTTNSIPSQKADHVGSSQNKKSYASSLNGDRGSKVEKQVTVVKGNTLSKVPLTPSLITPSLVLDDSCAAIHDFVSDERETMDIEENLVSSFARKRLCIKTKQADNILEKFKVIFKGRVYMACAKELFTWTPIFLDYKESEYISDDESLHGVKNKSLGSQHGEDDLVDDSDVEGFTLEVSRQENDHRGVDLNTKTDKDYISSLIARWNGKTIVMGDFNEVRSIDERFEIHIDYGPISFDFYHSLFKWDEFGVMVEQAWNSFSHSDNNGLIRGNVSDKILLKRMELMRQLHDINQMEAKDYVQKSKIKWAIEGDENLKFFHGIINKKRSQLSIRGAFVDGDWNTDPEVVKDVFKDHFATRFKQSAHGRLKLNISFPNRLSTNQIADMDRSVSRDDGIVARISLRVQTGVRLNSLGDIGGSLDLISVRLLNVSSKVGLFRREMFYKLLVSALTGASGFEALLVPRWLRSWLMGALLLNSLFCVLKQGDPLAPYLFILIMESLHISFSRATSDGLFKGEGPALIWKNIVKILKCFFLASGLKINIQNSQVLGDGVLRNIVNQAASSIGCAVMQNPFRYLGVMVKDSMSQKLAWADTVQKLRSRLSKWKVKTLSIGGRLTLLKLVFCAFPLYNMSIYKVPKGVLKEMEEIRCNFFNGADLAERKITWVSWDKVLASKKMAFLEFQLSMHDIFLPSVVNATRWVKYIPIKINVFALRARLDRLPTRGNLVHRGVVLDSFLCPLCGLVPEDIHHVLFWCDTAKLVFRRICHWWDLDWHDLLSFSN